MFFVFIGGTPDMAAQWLHSLHCSAEASAFIHSCHGFQFTFPKKKNLFFLTGKPLNMSLILIILCHACHRLRDLVIFYIYRTIYSWFIKYAMKLYTNKRWCSLDDSFSNKKRAAKKNYLKLTHFIPKIVTYWNGHSFLTDLLE